ncbi:MAG: tetratricopeptide repeat protein [Woeseiaceae bacterium]|nr:tetratricopeptide repeat protein [Woeseiaceae bacterium]
MNGVTRRSLLTLLAVLCAAGPLVAKEPETIRSLEKQKVELRPGRTIAGSNDKARDNYRAFLDLVSDDPELRAEAMRRLGDLELESLEAEQLTQNIDSIGGYDSAVGLFQQLLEAYPDYRRNDTVLYQLARAYEIAGQTDDALATLNELVDRYPETARRGEVEFRRGEMLFLRKDYDAAKAAYEYVVGQGETSRYYEQSLYKLGWSQFKLASHEESLDPFFTLLDRKVASIELANADDDLESLGRADRELVEDTFRVLSISFSYMDGAETIGSYFASRGFPSYTHVVYRNLGDLYLEKERYVDAAGAYAAFVEVEPWHPQAPLLQAEVIEAYKKGGFASLVLEAKEAFVERYGMDGEFWVFNPPEEHPAVIAQLKSNLTDLAQFYHAEAQRDGERSDYREAARWYRKFLAYFPDEPDSARTNFLLAEILYESEDYAAAMAEYERTAYEYPRHDQSAEAGYASLLSYRRHEESLAGDSATAWHQDYLDSGLRFADTYPEHPESGAVLTTVAEDLFGQNQFDLAIAVAQNAVGREPPIEAPLARTAWTVIAHSFFDLGRFADAESAYYQLRPLTPNDDPDARREIDDRIASSIYKQGEASRSAGDLEGAVAHFLRVGSAVPSSAIRETAEYDAAAALISLGAFERATGVLEEFRRDFPDSEYADDVTQKLAVTYQESGRSAAAAGEFERIAAAPDASSDVRREALWKAAELYETSGDGGLEEQVLQRIVSQFPSPLSESIEARHRLLLLAEVRGDDNTRRKRLEDLVRADATAGAERSDRTRYLAARASLELAEPLRERFEAARFTQPLDASLKRKKTLMEELVAAYGDAADYGIAEVTTAATFRLGQVYQTFGRDLMDSERPGDLDELALEQYELLLEEQAFPFEEQAIELFQANTVRAADGVYDEWVKRSFDALSTLMPARYAKLERSEDVITALY